MWESDDDGVPISSIQQLILELELVAAELKQFLTAEEKGIQSAN